jgi:hypothetical protein
VRALLAEKVSMERAAALLAVDLAEVRRPAKPRHRVVLYLFGSC